MQGPSAGKDVAAGPYDRWSLAVSSLLIVGLFVAGLAMVQNWRATPMDPRPVPPPSKPKAAMPEMSAQARTILLPPPPPPPQAMKPAPARPTAKPHIIQPLKRLAEAPRLQPMPRPVKPIKVTPLKPVPPAKPAARKTPRKTEGLGPVPEADAKPAPKPPSAQPVIDATRHRKTGGALLRLLEHGKGPSVEIAWPASAADRQRLFRALTRCYGMRPALLAQGNRLFDESATPGQPWAINRDRYSGFIRSPRGEPIAEENRQFAAIASRHGLTDWRPVRVFPRTIDAVLLGGLGTLLGNGYQAAGQIRAAYRLQRNGLSLTGFRVDGRAVGGVVSLPATLGRGCD